MVSQGVDIKYGKRLVRHNLPKKKKRRVYKNDGRPPDTSKALLSGDNKRKKSTTIDTFFQPVQNLTHDDDGFLGIPWGIKEMQVTNTCVMGTFLTLIYYINQFSVLAKKFIETHDADSVLSKTFSLLGDGKYNEARVFWAEHTRDKPLQEGDNLFSSLHAAYHSSTHHKSPVHESAYVCVLLTATTA